MNCSGGRWIWMTYLLVGGFAVACQGEAKKKPEPGQTDDDGEKGKKKKKKRKKWSKVDCTKYCAKQAECFSNSMETVKRDLWLENCADFCRDDVEEKRPVTLLHAAVVKCSDKPCTAPFGECIAKELDGAAIDMDPAGLHTNCHMFRACVDARVFRFPLEQKHARRDIYAENRAFFENKKKSALASESWCKQILESNACGDPWPREKEGEALTVSCADYCATAGRCFPKYMAKAEWRGNCDGACSTEAKLGTSAGVFFGAVASCKDKACGEEIGKCVDDHLTRTGGDVSWTWDMRGLGAACSVYRMCMEGSFFTSEPEAAVATRKITYESYRKVFADLKHAGGDTAKHCTTMMSYSEMCK